MNEIEEFKKAEERLKGRVIDKNHPDYEEYNKINKKGVGKTTVIKKIPEENKIRTSLYIDEKNKIIAEQVYEDGKNKFCVYSCNSKEDITYKDSIVAGGFEYLPIEDEEVAKKAILLPSKTEEYNTDEELELQIKNFINEWLDIPPEICQFAVWNTKRSWVYDRFHTLNYMRALGDTGQGKSRFLDTLGSVHYKSLSTSGATTSAPIFRIINKWKGTLVMDEADFQKSDEAQDIIKIINQGYEKGKFVMRCNKDMQNKVDFFDPYCPKILATRRTFEDKAVESRCITQVMTGTLRKDIKWNLNDNFWNKALSIRNKLLLWRFRNYWKIDPNKEVSLGLDDLEPRIQQIVGSFISMFANDEKKLNEFRDYIKKYQSELIEERMNSFEGQVVGGIHKLMTNKQYDMNVSDVIEAGEITDKRGFYVKPRTITSILKSLGFKKNVSKRVDNVVKRCLVLEPTHLTNLFQRYGYAVTVVTVYMETPQLFTPKEKEGQNELISDFSLSTSKRNNRNSVTDLETTEEAKVEEIISNGTDLKAEILNDLRTNYKNGIKDIDFTNKWGFDVLEAMLEKGELQETKNHFIKAT